MPDKLTTYIGIRSTGIVVLYQSDRNYSFIYDFWKGKHLIYYDVSYILL